MSQSIGLTPQDEPEEEANKATVVHRSEGQFEWKQLVHCPAAFTGMSMASTFFSTLPKSFSMMALIRWVS